jgi:heat shock protein HtpX
VIGLISAIGTNALSRCRELAADAGSATITGRPSALASALLKVSDSQAQIPRKDLRAAAALNAFNLVPVTRRHRWWHDIRPLVPFTRTHPGLPARIAALQHLEQRQQQPHF